VVLAIRTIASVSAATSSRFCSTVRPSYIWTVISGIVLLQVDPAAHQMRASGKVFP
jgi:hypothetical protein